MKPLALLICSILVMGCESKPKCPSVKIDTVFDILEDKEFYYSGNTTIKDGCVVGETVVINFLQGGEILSDTTQTTDSAYFTKKASSKYIDSINSLKIDMQYNY